MASSARRAGPAASGADEYFPDHVVDRGRAILLRLCERIEAEQPSDLVARYVLTQAATEEFNLLEAEFEAAGSETETAAREERCPPSSGLLPAVSFGAGARPQRARAWERRAGAGA